MVLIRDHNIYFYKKQRKIILKLSLLSFILSIATGSLVLFSAVNGIAEMKNEENLAAWIVICVLVVVLGLGLATLQYFW